MLAFTLTAFLELMDHGIVSWDMVSITFIKQVRPPAFFPFLLPQSPVVLQAEVGMQSVLHSGMSRFLPLRPDFHPGALLFLWFLQDLPGCTLRTCTEMNWALPENLPKVALDY